MREAEGYDIASVEAWIAENIPGLQPPFEWTKLQGGHSNLTFRLDDALGRSAVIRRPPLGELLPKAHDMSREWSVISALGPTPVPVPAALGFCPTPDVTGAWFYVMGLIDGRPLYSADETRGWVPESQRITLAHSFIDVLAELHKLDPDAIGLQGLGKKDGYVARQLKTWYRSWNASVEHAEFDEPLAHELQAYFLAHLPEQGVARVVHGDYGLHNCLIGGDSTVVAVVDWEISTLGDPLADLAYALLPWVDPRDKHIADPEAATSVSAVPTRSELASRYALSTGADISALDYYIGFNCWKSAAILQGVYARYRAGNKKNEGADMAALRQRVSAALERAAMAINQM